MKSLALALLTAVPISLLIGDVTASGPVDGNDVVKTQNHSSHSHIRALPACTKFEFTLDASYQTSAGVFSDGKLIRTLWRKVRYGPGSFSYCWDGKDDNGSPVTGGPFEIRLLYHTVQYVWDGVIGNTSSASSGSTPHRGSTFMQSLAIAGSNAFYAIGECEGFNPVSQFNTTSDQSRTSVLAPDALTNFDFVATDGTLLYMADSGSSGETQVKPSSFNTFVIAHKLSDNSEFRFDKGKPVMRLLKYSSCIDVDTYSPSLKPAAAADPKSNPRRPTGLAVQKSGNILAVAHGGLNVVRLFEKTSGALLPQSIFVRNPQGLATDPNGDLWIITGKSVRRYTNLATNPVLTQTISGFTAPVAMAVHPSNADLVVVADGGRTQLVQAFNRTSKTASKPIWSYGQNGGYATNGPGVSNTKLQFQVGAANSPIYHAALAVGHDGSFWIGDGATERLLHVKPDRSDIFDADTIMFLTKNGCTAVDPNHPRRIIGDDFLEFDVDYTKPLEQAWTLKNNWAAGMSSKYFGANDGIQIVSTLNNGRVYGTIRDFSIDPSRHPKVVVELSAAGLRICKNGDNKDLFLPLIPVAPSYYGSWRDCPAFAGDGSLRYHTYSTGPTVSWFERRLSGFDRAFNPQWGPSTWLASAPYTDSDPVSDNEAGGSTGNNSMPITSSKVIVSLVGHAKNGIPPRGAIPKPIPATGWHLGGIPINAKQWGWKGSPSVASDVPFDGLGSFDLGDGIQYSSSIAMAVGHNVIYGYPGELWNQSEASQWMHFYDDGLFVGQFGTSGNYHHVSGSLLADILPGFSGNAFFPSLVSVGADGIHPDPNGDVYLWANDESQHSGIHRWHILGANTIREQTGTVVVGGSVSLTAPATSFPTVLVATPGNGQVGLSWKPGSGVTTYDVKRAVTNGGPYTKIGSGSGNSFTVSGLTNGTPYYFAVSAAGSLLNTNEVEAWAFSTVDRAGMLRGGIDRLVRVGANIARSSTFQVNSSAMAQQAPSLADLNNVLGNLTRTNIGTLGYVLYDNSGPGDNVNLKQGFTITKGSGWAVQSNTIGVANRFDVNGNPGIKEAIYPSPTATITVNTGGDMAVHYLTVFCPPFSNDGRSFTLSLAPTGGGGSVTYSAAESDGTYLLIYQFEFTGNVTLTATNTSGNPSDDCIQGVFLD